jgi:hypothetical protein
MRTSSLNRRKSPAVLFSVAILALSGLVGCSSTVTSIQVSSTPIHVVALAPAATAAPAELQASAPTALTTGTRMPIVQVAPIRTATPATPVKPSPARAGAATPTAAPRSTPTRRATALPPTKTEIRRSGTQFTLLVKGQPIVIKGMNYNVNYTSLPEETQLSLHRRDFKIMRDAGVNAVIGWGIYDETSLAVAQEYGIGIIMPFELDPNGPYENEDYRNQIKADFRDYIKRFKDFPAVWGWNPGGDELLYRMDTEQHRTVDKLQIAADLELDLAALARSLDPNHINVIKEPRDWYIRYLGTSLQKLKTQPNYQNLNSSLVYGVNVYGHTADIQMALTNAKATLTGQLGIAMLVTEFGPFNSPREQRASDYPAIWDVVARISNLGGLVYVFGPDQPNPSVANPYDPLTLLPSEYSLVDNAGTPIDDSLVALAADWRTYGAPPAFPSPTRTVTR